MDPIRKYRRALDRVLMQSPDALLAFMREHGTPEPSCREVLEMTFHKTRTASRSLPIELRRQSKAWLQARGFHSLDDGEL